jgi:hypothetical protein
VYLIKIKEHDVNGNILFSASSQCLLTYIASSLLVKGDATYFRARFSLFPVVGWGRQLNVTEEGGPVFLTFPNFFMTDKDKVVMKTFYTAFGHSKT